MKYSLSDKELLVVEVPEDANDFWLHMNSVCFKLGTKYGQVRVGEGIFSRKQMFESVGAKYKILARAKDITEDQAEGLVGYDGDYMYDGEHEQVLYRDYRTEEKDLVQFTALESFKSWCKANKIKESDLILIKNK